MKKKEFVEYTFEEFMEYLDGLDCEIMILANDYFCFGSICKVCGDIKPESRKYLYPEILGEEVDIYELEEEIENDLTSDMRIYCENDAVFCVCEDEEDEDGYQDVDYY